MPLENAKGFMKQAKRLDKTLKTTRWGLIVDHLERALSIQGSMRQS